MRVCFVNVKKNCGRIYILMSGGGAVGRRREGRGLDSVSDTRLQLLRLPSIKNAVPGSPNLPLSLSPS